MVAECVFLIHYKIYTYIFSPVFPSSPIDYGMQAITVDGVLIFFTTFICWVIYSILKRCFNILKKSF